MKGPLKKMGIIHPRKKKGKSNLSPKDQGGSFALPSKPNGISRRALFFDLLGSKKELFLYIYILSYFLMYVNIFIYFLYLFFIFLYLYYINIISYLFYLVKYFWEKIFFIFCFYVLIKKIHNKLLLRTPFLCASRKGKALSSIIFITFSFM